MESGLASVHSSPHNDLTSLCDSEWNWQEKKVVNINYWMKKKAVVLLSTGADNKVTHRNIPSRNCTTSSFCYPNWPHFPKGVFIYSDVQCRSFNTRAFCGLRPGSDTNLFCSLENGWEDLLMKSVRIYKANQYMIHYWVFLLCNLYFSLIFQYLRILKQEISLKEEEGKAYWFCY